MKKSIDGKTIEMDFVESKYMSTVGYDEETQVLSIEFTRGPVYVYNAVPKSTYEELLAAEAIDDYFNENIRNSYPNKRVW